MTEEGLNINDQFPNIDSPFQEFLEDQIIDLKTRAKPTISSPAT